MFMMLLQLFEITMIFMHLSGAMIREKQAKCVKYRKILGIACNLVCFLCVWGIYKWDGDKIIEALASDSNNCTNDEIL